MLRELINNFLESISPFIVLLVLLAFRKHWKSMEFMKVLFFYYLCSSFILGIATYLAYVNVSSNIFWYNLQGFCSLLILSLFYYRILKTNRNKKLVLFLSIAGAMGYVIILFFFDDSITFNSAGYSIGSFLIILYSLLFLREVFSFANKDPVHTEVTIWIVGALLTYFLSSFLIQVSYKYVTEFLTSAFKEKIKDSWLWGINNVLYFLANMIVAINITRLPGFSASDDNKSG
ncbi:MAG TPA: hypothetical protein VEB42_01115 [Chitinophagaceae bacterium]|nr:hypothetical protein [Chitinophagaceae bacterium]